MYYSIIDLRVGTIYNDFKNIFPNRRARVVTTNLGWPNGIALDKIKKKIFWTDAHVRLIEHFPDPFHDVQLHFSLSIAESH